MPTYHRSGDDFSQECEQGGESEGGTYGHEGHAHHGNQGVEEGDVGEPPLEGILWGGGGGGGRKCTENGGRGKGDRRRTWGHLDKM